MWESLHHGNWQTVQIWVFLLKGLGHHPLPVPLSGHLTLVYFLEAQEVAAIFPQKLSGTSPALRGGREAASSPYPF